MAETCETCRWWKARHFAVFGCFGSCQLGPPHAGAAYEDKWPQTYSKDRCGRWEARSTATDGGAAEKARAKGLDEAYLDAVIQAKIAWMERAAKLEADLELSAARVKELEAAIVGDYTAIHIPSGVPLDKGGAIVQAVYAHIRERAGLDKPKKAAGDTIWRCNKCGGTLAHAKDCDGLPARLVWNGGEYVPEEATP